MTTKGYTQKLPAAIDELVDNSLAAFAMLNDGLIQISVTIAERADGRWQITVVDSGPGIPIERIGDCMSMGRAKRAYLNEHGCGLKNVLAFLCPRLEEGLWRIVVRPTGSDNAYEVRSPWGDGMEVRQVAASEHAYPTGVTITMTVEDNVMRFYGAQGRPKLRTILERLHHHLGVTYALHPLLNHKRRTAIFTLNGDRVNLEGPQNARIVKKVTGVTRSLAPGAPAVPIDVTHYRLDEPNSNAKEFFMRNTKSSGLMVYQHGRLMQLILPNELYGFTSNHNDFNPCLIIASVTGDPKGIPPTVTTKNRLMESDPLTQGLLDYVREVVPASDARDPKADARDCSEGELVRRFINGREVHAADFGDGYSITENRGWPMGDGADKTPPIDVVEIMPASNSVILYEAKKLGCSVDDLMELWRNSVFVRRVSEFEGRIIRSVLLSTVKESQLSPQVLVILETLRAQDSGFKCEFKTWGDYGIGTAN